jgi:hypothetical protein
LAFTVDPDQIVTQDANRSNNYANVSIFIGRAPTANFVVDEGKYTFENVTLNATASFDEDGGDVECRFEIESRSGLIDVIDAPDCWTQWNWSDSGIWNIKLIVIDNELDFDVIDTNVTILNRAPYINLSMPDSIPVESSVTIDATDSGDVDTTSPTGQQVTISWPGTNCQEGLTQPTCTFIPLAEGEIMIVAEAMDDDGTVTTVNRTLNVLNIAPTLNIPELWNGGQNISLDENGTWYLDEDQVVLLRVNGDDTLSDRDDLNIEWLPSHLDSNWSETTNGPASTVSVSWQTSGEHIISVAAWDDDGEKSDDRTAKIMISNVVPTITGLPGDAPIFEDDYITLNVEVSDTISDLDSLEICWDLNGAVDLNSDGDTTNDCQETGANMTLSWPTTGIRWITATVTDDDGASASQSVNISVQNLPPRSVISTTTNLTDITEGDSVFLSAKDSIDTPTDKSNLVYQWKSNHLVTGIDSDGDDDIDYYGINYTMENESASSTMTIVVKATPSNSILDSISNEIGSVGTGILALLFSLVIGLSIFLLITRKPSKPTVDKYQSYGGFVSGASPPTSEPSSDLFGQATVAPSQQPSGQYDPFGQAGTEVTQPQVQQPAVTQPVQTNQGPVLPTTGLPEGWTMEQWDYYGQQWLDANKAPQPLIQPATNNTPATSVSTSMSSLLDDLDF